MLQDDKTTPTLFHRPSGKTYRPDHTMVSADISAQCCMEVLEDLGSDHLPILINIPTRKGENAKRREPRWNYSKADWDVFRSKTDEMISRINNTTSIEKQLSEFTDAVLQAAGHSIPKGSRKKHQPIWSEQIQEAVNTRRKARKRAEKDPSVENKKEYNK